jgi:hypothetical protein
MQGGPCILWDYIHKRLKLAQLLDQLGVFLTRAARAAQRGRAPVGVGVSVAERHGRQDQDDLPR